MAGEQKYYVDIPVLDSDSWKSCLIGVSKETALAWIRKNIGHCDDKGRICLLTLMADEVSVTFSSDNDKPMSTRITDIWKAFGGEKACSRSTFSAVYNGTYAAMDGPLAQEILAFIDGYVEPEKFGF